MKSSDTGAILSAKSVTRRFGGVMAVDSVTLDIARGGISGLIGPNGAGKSTFFDVLAGERKPTSGQVLLNGRAVHNRPAHSRSRAGLGRTFQIPRPFGGMSLVENVMLARQQQSGEHIWPNIFASSRVAREEREIYGKAMSLLEFTTLAHLAHQPARILSGGQRKLLELARVLMAEPEIILLDEPAAGVNPALLEIIIARIAQINRDGTTFLIIEHNMDMIARLCGHVFVMASGSLLCQGQPQDVARDPRVIEAYLGNAAA